MQENIIETIDIPLGIKYLSEQITELPANCIFDKGKVGCGGTTIALEISKKPYVIAVPFLELINNKYNKYKDQIFCIKSGYTSKKDIQNYINSVEIPKIMVTYDSLYKLNDLIDTSKFNLLIDEYHLLFTEYCYRSKAVHIILENYTKYKEFCFMTATILEEEFILKELKHLPLIQAIWEDVIIPKVISIKCKYNLYDTVVKNICEHLLNEREGNAYYFVNSVEFIKTIVKDLNLTDDVARAIWSEGNEKSTGLIKGKSYDKPKKINFITKTGFEGCDFYDENGIIYIISEGKRSTTLLDISTSFQQIAGRIRNTKYIGLVNHIYSNTRYTQFDSNLDDFIIESNNEWNKTIPHIEFLNTADEELRQSLTIDLKYAYKLDNKFLMDENLKMKDIWNFKVTKHLYSNRINLTDEIKKYGYHDINYIENNLKPITRMDKILPTFEETIKEIEKNKNDKELLDAAIIQWPFINDAIKKLGYAGIKNKKYNVTNIKKALIVKSNEDYKIKIYKLLSMKLRLSNDNFIESKKLKSIFSDIYKELGIYKIPVASNINDYYTTKSIVKNVNGCNIAGYIIRNSKIKIN